MPHFLLFFPVTIAPPVLQIMQSARDRGISRPNTSAPLLVCSLLHKVWARTHEKLISQYVDEQDHKLRKGSVRVSNKRFQRFAISTVAKVGRLERFLSWCPRITSCLRSYSQCRCIAKLHNFQMSATTQNAWTGLSYNVSNTVVKALNCAEVKFCNFACSCSQLAITNSWEPQIIVRIDNTEQHVKV